MLESAANTGMNRQAEQKESMPDYQLYCSYSYCYLQKITDNKATLKKKKNGNSFQAEIHSPCHCTFGARYVHR